MHLLFRELSKAQDCTTVCSNISSGVIIGCGLLIFWENISFLDPRTTALK